MVKKTTVPGKSFTGVKFSTVSPDDLRVGDHKIGFCQTGKKVSGGGTGTLIVVIP